MSSKNENVEDVLLKKNEEKKKVKKRSRGPYRKSSKTPF